MAKNVSQLYKLRIHKILSGEAISFILYYVMKRFRRSNKMFVWSLLPFQAYIHKAQRRMCKNL